VWVELRRRVEVTHTLDAGRIRATGRCRRSRFAIHDVKPSRDSLASMTPRDRARPRRVFGKLAGVRWLVLFALACGHHDAPPREPSLPRRADAAVDAGLWVATDASSSAPSDASDTSIDAPVAVEQPSPPVLVGTLIAVTAEKTHSILTVDVGKRSGVDMHWHAALLDDNNGRVEKLEMVSVSDRTCRVRSKLTSDVVRAYHRVAFEP
jgi:hypothetical protein